MQKIITVLLALVVAVSCHRQSNSTTCTVQGVSHVRSFMARNRVDSCYQYGARVLYDSPNIKVTSYSYMDETLQSQVDWASTKLFVEFYGDIIGLPVALFSSDILQCPCAGPCLESRTVDKVFSMGLNNVVDVIVRRDVESTVAYLSYKRANVTLYVRYTSEGFNFGIRAPEYLALRASGVCVSGCQRVVDQSAVECIRDEFIQPAVDICREVFADLVNYTSLDVNFEESRIKPCARDISQRFNATVALSHRYTYIDELLLANFSTIIQRYSELTASRFAWNWTQYDARVEDMARNCVEKAAPIEAASQSLSSNKTGRIAVGRMSLIDLSGQDVPKNKSDLLLFTPILAEPSDNVTASSTIHIDLSNDHFFDFSPIVSSLSELPASEVNMMEWRMKCKNQRTTQLGNFYMPYPSNETLFVQCDESNRAFVKQCPFGTVFTVRMVCEPAAAQLPLQRTPKLGDILTNGKAPLQIDLVRTVPTLTMTTTTVVPEVLLPVVDVMLPAAIANPCTNESRAQGLFLFPHPTDAVQFILCDQANNMTIGQCMTGTRFSVATRSCQKF